MFGKFFIADVDLDHVESEVSGDVIELGLRIGLQARVTDLNNIRTTVNMYNGIEKFLRADHQVFGSGSCTRTLAIRSRD